jgi:hypothetical protein
MGLTVGYVDDLPKNMINLFLKIKENTNDGNDTYVEIDLELIFSTLSLDKAVGARI